MASAEPVVLRIEEVSKHFSRRGHDVEALGPVSLDVRRGELVSIIGPSGCGKSTLLNMVAGLVWPSGGRLLLEGRPLSGPGPDRGLVCQTYTLYPWHTVEDNIGFGLMLAGKPLAERRRVAARYIEEMGLGGFVHAYPKELSGGMQQRVAIARALATSPTVLLMDEPFGALDAQTRESMQELVLRVQALEHTTVLFVTHDIDEAVYLSDRVLVMSARPGKLIGEFRPPVGERDRLSPAGLDLKREIHSLLRERVAATA